MPLFQKICLASALVCALFMTSALAAEDDSPEDIAFSGGGTVTCSGSTVHVGFENHDTLSVPSGIAETAHDGSEMGSLQAVLRDLFGVYTPRTQTVDTYYDGQVVATAQQVIPGLAGLDWEWLASVFLFALVLFCLFRLLGGVVRYG